MAHRITQKSSEETINFVREHLETVKKLEKKYPGISFVGKRNIS